MQLGNIFNSEQYDEAYQFILSNQDLTIAEIETKNNKRQFQIIEIIKPTKEEKETKTQAIRDAYLEKYVDPYLSDTLRWNELSAEKQNSILAYQQYLLNITKQENFPDIYVENYIEWST